MLLRVGMALLVAGIAGGTPRFASPASPVEPFGRVIPVVRPWVEPPLISAEQAPGDSLAPVLASAPEEPRDPPLPGEPSLEPENSLEVKPKDTAGEDPRLAAAASPLSGPIDDPAQLLPPEAVRPVEPSVPGEPPPAPDGFMAVLNSALRFMTLDGRVQLKATGRLYFDAALLNAERSLESLVGDFEDGLEVRAARLGVLGVVDFAEFKFEFDFAGGGVRTGDTNLKDAWIGVRNVPLLGRLRIGKVHEPVGLESMMSGNARTFMEPALPICLTPGRSPGLVAIGTGLSGRLNWWVGIFGYNRGGNQLGVLGSNLSARVCGTPWLEKDGERLLHLGLSASFRHSVPDSWTISQRPEAYLAPNIVTTPSFTPHRVLLFGLETAVVDGPFSLQGELQSFCVETDDGDKSTFWGAYLYGSIILTGEHREYLNGLFLRPKVKKVAFGGGLGGAWELAVRLSRLDLSGGDPDGGIATNATVGLNWYMDDHSRLMINYVRSYRVGVGAANILECRLQFDF